MLQNKTVFITGASGLLAINIIEDLLLNNYKVIGLLRNKSKFPLSNHKNLEIIIGDITQPESYLEAIKNSEIVIHVAAITDQNITDYSVYQKVNVDASKTLLEKSIENDIETFINVSSANAFGYGSLQNPGNETKSIKAPFDKSLYAQSKLEAQNAVFKVGNSQQKTKVITVNPTFMIGKYDTKPSSGRIILSAVKKKIIFYPPGGKSFINVKDAAQTIVKAIDLGKHGESYLLSGENLSYKQFYKKVTKALQQKSKFVKIPKAVLITVGYLGSITRFFGVKTDISVTNLKTLCVSNFYSNQKAREQLNHQQNNIENGINDAVKWFDLK
ncbi:NAD-dependent epimerase/dehydratase family protein [Polaribacter sp.]|uniref:NAD-dependent epimerase/dehydratase family protein n=1 Tax=Polaribacter sp. TaxID=1920175 RepID=UPI003F6BE698